MTKIADAFANGKAFIPFLTCGDPDLETTEKLISAIADAGADLIELGIPFSDPTAEGPVIQDANLRALSGGVTTDKIFDMVRRVRQTVSIPMVFMTYANVIFSYGAEKFLKTMIAPTSHDRIRAIAEQAEGFLYCVSSLGVTGTRSNITTDIGAMVKLVKEVNDIPCAVGFGISTPEQAESMCRQADGAIVGSAIVKLIAKYGRDSVQPVAEYVKSIKDACRRAD